MYLVLQMRGKAPLVDRGMVLGHIAENERLCCYCGPWSDAKL